MTDPPDHPEAPSDLRSPFIFVRRGDPEPTEWMATHPGWVKFPATMVPRAASAAKPIGRATVPSERPAQVDHRGLPELNPPNPARPDPHDPMNPHFDPVVTLRRLGYTPYPGPGAQPVQWWAPLLESPLAKPPEGFLPRFMERIPRQSGKEAADKRSELGSRLQTPGWRNTRRLREANHGWPWGRRSVGE